MTPELVNNGFKKILVSMRKGEVLQAEVYVYRWKKLVKLLKWQKTANSVNVSKITKKKFNS
jgi:hypothetical protein